MRIPDWHGRCIYTRQTRKECMNSPIESTSIVIADPRARVETGILARRVQHRAPVVPGGGAGPWSDRLTLLL